VAGSATQSAIARSTTTGVTSAPLGAAAATGGVVAIVSVLGGVRLAARLLTRRTGGIEPMVPSR
jgi:hypothetical protein